MKRNQSHGFGPIVLALVALGCKPQPGSTASVKTLDNFTRADGALVQNYFCGLAMTDGIFHNLKASDRRLIDAHVVVPGDDKALKYAVAGALAAVPKAMQQVFYAGRGQIRVVADAKKECGKVNLTDAEKAFASESSKDQRGNYSFDGCWQVEDGRVEIILANKPAVIHHGLLRLFGFVYTQLFAKGIDKVPALADGVARFKRQRGALGAALLQDLAAVSPAKAKLYKDFSGRDQEAYENSVFSEAIDSAYCSATSRAVFEKQFPRTFAAFGTGADALLKDFGSPLY